MSPGGFDSVSAGVAGADGAELGALPDVSTLGWFGVGVAVNAPHPASSVVRLTTTKPTHPFAPNLMTPPPNLGASSTLGGTRLAADQPEVKGWQNVSRKK
jgi:hypothetical protein